MTLKKPVNADKRNMSKTGGRNTRKRHLLPREALANTMPRFFQAPARPCRARGTCGTKNARGRVLSRSPRMDLIDRIPGTTSTDMVDGRRIVHHAALLGELLVEAEDGAFLLTMGVSRAAAAGQEDGVGGGRRERDEGGGTGCIGAGGYVFGVDVCDVTGAATAGVVVVAGGNRGVRLGDLVGWHFGLWQRDFSMWIGFGFGVGSGWFWMVLDGSGWFLFDEGRGLI